MKTSVRLAMVLGQLDIYAHFQHHQHEPTKANLEQYRNHAVRQLGLLGFRYDASALGSGTSHEDPQEGWFVVSGPLSRAPIEGDPGPELLDILSRHLTQHQIYLHFH